MTYLHFTDSLMTGLSGKTGEDQEAVLMDMISCVVEGGLLVFTSGVENVESWSNNGGEMLFHASLSSEEYHNILQTKNMKLIQHNVSDPDCGGATVWVVQKSKER